MEFDEIQKARHYNSHKSGIELIKIIRHCSFNVGQVFKYLWRAGVKDENTLIEDHKKAAYYLNDEIERIGGESKQMEQERVLRAVYEDSNPVASTYEKWYQAWLRKMDLKDAVGRANIDPIIYKTPSQEDAEKALQERLSNAD